MKTRYGVEGEETNWKSNPGPGFMLPTSVAGVVVCCSSFAVHDRRACRKYDGGEGRISVGLAQ